MGLKAVSVLVLLLIMPPVHPALCQQGEQEMREIEVRVRLANQNGEPIEGWPLALFTREEVSDYAPFTFGLTNAEGTLTLRGEIKDHIAHFFLGATGVPSRYGFTSFEEERLIKQRMAELRKLFYFPQFNAHNIGLKISVEDHRLEEVIELKAIRAVAVSGVVASEKGDGLVYHGMVMARLMNKLWSTNKNGVFELAGIPTETENELFILTYPLVLSYALNASELIKDKIVGPFRILDVDRPIEFELRLTNFYELNRLRFLEQNQPVLSSGITLISPLGQLMYAWLAQGDDYLVSEYKVGQYPKAPPGKFYIVPGVFRARDIQLTVLDALRQGLNLDEFGVPSVEFKEGERLNITIDALKAAQAIGRVRAKLNELNQPVQSQN